MASSNTVSSGPSAWAPLRVAAFRSLWIAQLFSMIGTWMQTVGAQWLLVDEPNAATLVGLVQTAAMLPTLVLALPAGALADILDRRRLLIAVQLFQVVVGVVLLALTSLDRLSAARAAADATFLLGDRHDADDPGLPGAGAGAGRPATDAVGDGAQRRRDESGQGGRPGDRRPADRRRSGSPRCSPSTRSATWRWPWCCCALRPAPAEETLLPERFRRAIASGARYVRHSPAVRRMLLRTLLFVVPGAAVWALLPLVASAGLGLDATGYGLLLGALGIGAVLGAAVLPRVVSALCPNQLVLLAASGIRRGHRGRRLGTRAGTGSGGAGAGRRRMAVDAGHHERQPADVPARLGAGARPVDLPDGLRRRSGARLAWRGACSRRRSG